MITIIFEPRQKNRAPDIFALAMFVCAAVAAGFSSWNAVRGRGYLQAFALVLFGILIYVLVRYKFTRIRYAVRFKTVKKGYGSEDDDDEEEEERVSEGGEVRPITAAAPEKLEFIIEKAQSRNTFVTECLVELTDIIFCKPYPYADKQRRKDIQKEAGKGPTYKYLKNMVGADTWFMCVKTSQGTAKIIFEPDAKMGEYLSAVAGYNKERK